MNRKASAGDLVSPASPFSLLLVGVPKRAVRNAGTGPAQAGPELKPTLGESNATTQRSRAAGRVRRQFPRRCQRRTYRIRRSRYRNGNPRKSHGRSRRRGIRKSAEAKGRRGRGRLALADMADQNRRRDRTRSESQHVWNHPIRRTARSRRRLLTLLSVSALAAALGTAADPGPQEVRRLLVEAATASSMGDFEIAWASHRRPWEIAAGSPDAGDAMLAYCERHDCPNISKTG